MNRRLIIDDGRSERELLVAGTMVVGRDPECEISSNDPRLSRRHAEFRPTPTGLVVRDLGSRNGVRVNGRQITEAVLASGDVVSLAHLSLRLVEEGVPVGAAPPAVTRAMAVTPPVEDDRTRVSPVPGRPRPVPVPAAVPSDVGEIVIRDAPSDPAGPSAGGAAAVADELGVLALARLRWGRRALAQGVALAALVFLVTAVPLMAWQVRAFGTSALVAWPVLVPPLAASALAGAMVAGLIARTALRGAGRASRR